MDIRMSIITDKKHVAVHITGADDALLDKIPGLKTLVEKTHGAGNDTDLVEINAGNVDQYVAAPAKS